MPDVNHYFWAGLPIATHFGIRREAIFGAAKFLDFGAHFLQSRDGQSHIVRFLFRSQARDKTAMGKTARDPKDRCD
jgi:hypothetical protein